MGTFRTAAYHTLGCKLNFAETSTLARALAEAGYARVAVEERPDVFVLNTCSVTENADKECRRHVRRFKAINPEAFVAVIGCYAQLKPQEIAAIPGVDLVLGANEKFDLAQHIEQRIDADGPGGEVVAGAIKEVKRFIPSWSAADRTRTFLKVQDGCDYFCSFCTIPLARGRSRSGTIAETLTQAEAIAAQGIQEVVLTGVNTGDFGKSAEVTLRQAQRDSELGMEGKVAPASAPLVRLSPPKPDTTGRETFFDLVQALEHVEGIARFRISSIEPNLLTNAIIDHVARSDRFAPHFHIPLQSGSDTILKRMRRRYDTALYAERVAHIKRVMPHACIGVDVITGTPGETDEEFQRTHAFLRSIPVDYLHVFTYSERANTTAVRMDDSVPMEVRRERTQQLRILSSKLHRAFQERHLGTTRPVLFEAEEHDGTMQGYTDNYVRVSLPFDAALVNTVVPVELQRINGDGQVAGELRAVERPVGQLTH